MNKITEDLNPIRKTRLKMPEKSPHETQKIFAVRLETDKSELLIPFKIYCVKSPGEIFQCNR